MKSSARPLICVASLCLLSFEACTNADVPFTAVSGAAGAPSAGAGASGRDPGGAGNGDAGFGARVGDAGNGGVSGGAGDAGSMSDGGASGKGSAGMSHAGNSQGGSGGGGNAGHGGVGGNAGHGGVGGNAGGGAGHGGTGGNAGGGAGHGGTGGNAGGGAGRGGTGGTGGTAGTPAVCGNKLLEKGEQCDDGNSKNWDACDASCAFEQSQRANSLELRFETSSLCSKNAFGTAILGSAQTELQSSLNQRIADGSLSLLFAFRGLSDLTGISTESISLGVLYGAPSTGPDYDGKSDLDWWYSPAAGQIGSGGQPRSNLSASLVAGVLSVNSGNLQLPLLTEDPLDLSSTKLRLNLGDASKPLASSGAPPGHLASEHLRASLVSFESGGQPANGVPGELCGNISAASLSAVVIPAAYADGGASECSEGYSAARTFLDLLVGGCTLHHGDTAVILPTQPDQVDAAATQGGAGAPYRLTSNPKSNAVTGCRDKNDDSVSLATCLKAAAFSSAFRFKTGRVIIK